MENMRDKQANKRPETRPHDRFLELCAASTAGDLSSEEEAELQAHLAGCDECRTAFKEFEAAADLAVPLLSSTLAEQGEFDRGHPAGQVARAPRSLLERGSAAKFKREVEPRVFAFAHRDGQQATPVNWSYAWLPLAASVVLALTLATLMYRAGKNRHAETVFVPSSAHLDAHMEALEEQISDAEHERELFKAQLTERDHLITDLRRKIEEQSASLGDLQAAEVKLQNAISGEGAEKHRVADEQGALEQKLMSAEASVQNMQNELASARAARADTQAQDVGLRAQIIDLNGQLREREQTISRQEDLLSHDRDIRDLMGARDLYIAEVYDVGRDAATQKPCGRLFYTRGKSLIFYAYDLDQQPGVNKPATFQAWGRRGTDMQAALNLGIFYEDSVAKKRWVLKSNDTKALEQIDAVFVTVEPNGGSHKPSGRPLLFAYLKIDPNHP